MTKQMIRWGGHHSWIDAAKGLGLLLVVIGHLYYDSTLPLVNRLIYSFHMPMFFIISGFLTRTKDREPMREFIQKKFWRLLVPVAIYFVGTLPVYFLGVHLDKWEFSLAALFFFNGRVAYNDPCWYFIVLFEAMVVERALNVSGRRPVTQFAFACVFFFAGGLVYRTGLFLPFGLDRMLVALGFVTVGMLARGVQTRLGCESGMVNFPLLLTCGILWLIFGGYLNGKVSMYGFELGRYEWFILSGILGSLFAGLLCFWRGERWYTLQRWGRNAPFVVGTHYVALTAFKMGMNRLGFLGTWIYDIAALLFAVTLIALYMPLCEWLNLRAPALTGRAGKRIVGRESNANQGAA